MDNNGPTSVLMVRPSAEFVETPYIRDLTDRSLDYLKAGFPIHFSGMAGVGKTTLALHVAARLGRPVVLVSGDHEFNTSDLVGGLYGYHKRFMKDNFIRSVLKTDESMTSQWVDNRLTNACRSGFTLIYDEFTRSRPEANNVLLSVLEEKLLPLSAARGGESYLKVHPDFRAIFTSNPKEFAGVYSSQDALRDRMITIELGNFDEETEVAVTQAKSGLPVEEARQVVHLVRSAREAKSNKLTPTVRACIMIGKIMRSRNASLVGNANSSWQVCLDLVMPCVPKEEHGQVLRAMDEVIGSYARGEVRPGEAQIAPSQANLVGV